MADYVEMKECPICKTPVHRIDDVPKKKGKREQPVLACNNCKRVFHWIDDMWISEARQVRIKREPKIGDTSDDFLETD